MAKNSNRHLAGEHGDFSECAAPVDAVYVAAHQWQEFLESSPDPMWIKDAQGRYVAVNKAYLHADPRRTQDVIGKTDFEIQSREKAEIYIADDQIAARDGISEHEFSAVDQAGNLRYYNTKKVALHDVDGLLTGVLGQARDITSQRRVELALALENRRSRLFQGILEAAAAAATVGAFLADVLTLAHELFDYDRGGVYLLDPDRRTAHLVSVQGDSEAVQGQAASVPADQEPFLRVYRDAEPFFSAAWHNLGSSGRPDDPPWTLAVVPLVNLGRVVGSLDMAWRTPPQLEESWRESLGDIAREITIGMDRIETMAALQENTSNLQAFFNSVQGFFFVVGRDGKILAVGEQGAHRLGRTPTELLGTDINDLHPQEERELSRMILGDMINGTRTSSTQTLVAADGAQIPVNTLVTRGSWNGALALFTTSQDVTGSRRAAEALAADRTRADALYGIIEAAGKAESMEEFLPEALTIALEATPFEGGGIYIVDGDHAMLACATGFGSELIEQVRSVPVDEQPYRTALREGKTAAFTEFDPMPPGGFRQYGIGSMMSIPIVAGDTVVGALNLASAHSQNAELRMDLLMSIGRTIGEAVVRLRADASLRASREDFDALFEAIPRLVFILQEDGTIARVNKAAADRLGRRTDELCGTAVLDFCPSNRRAEVACILADMVAGRTTICALPFLSREGELVQIATQVVRTSWGGKPAIFGVGRELNSGGLDGESSAQTVLNDELTGLYSASGFSAIASQQLKMAHRGHINAALVVAEIVSGADAGPPEPHMLADFADILRQTFRDSDTIGRISTARFSVLAIQTDNTRLDLLAQRLKESITTLNAQRPSGKPGLVARVAVTPVDAMRPALLEDLLSQAGAELGGPD
ncbi:MAG: PAS domain-containing protein [Caldiserica bacterium]|nr:PAS domain-containing protein [Caldisericota bacterium]